MHKTNPHLFFIDGEMPGAPGLRGTCCHHCNQVVLLQVAACPRCAGRELTSVCIGQRAVLGHFSEVFHSLDGFEAPYFIGLVHTSEGPVTFAPIDAPAGTPLRVGMPLRFKLLARGQGKVGFAYAIEEGAA
jgi:uncharacterized OB-fold protein